MKKQFILFCLLSSAISSHAQFNCAIDVTPLDTTICPGDSVFIFATANLVNNNQAFNFNASSVPTGWSTIGTAQFTAPCGPSPSNTAYYWAATSSGVPGITTSAFDVTCGGFINFKMIYSQQSGPSPCEGPDQYNEGVSLQYSTNGGATWINIQYYAPNGTILVGNPGTTAPGATGVTPFTTWNTFNVPIPSAALSTNTRFRWIQFNSSGTCCDNWGLDDIVINSSGAPCGSGAVVNWSSGLTNTTSFYASPVNDTAFVAYVYDTLGNFQCQSDTIYINVRFDNFSYNLVDTLTINCTNGTAQATVSNISNQAFLPVSYAWSTGSTSGSANLAGAGVAPAQITYYVSVTDACGIVETDSVVLNVTQNLFIDAGPPQTLCEGDLVTLSGNSMNTVNWNNSIQNNVAFNPLTSQYFYASVSDGLGCSEMDSVFITVIDTTSSYMPIVAVDSFILNGQTYNTPGIYTQILPNANGCDSTITLDLTVLYSTSSTDVQSHCETYTWMDGVTYTSSTNTPTWTIPNVAGADSVITLDLTIRYGTTGTDTQVSCDTYQWIDGNTYTTDNNTAEYTLVNSVGCDSLVTLNLTMNYADTTEESYLTCFVWDSIPFIQVYTNRFGCDSTHTIFPIQIPSVEKPVADFKFSLNPIEVLFDPLVITNMSNTFNTSTWFAPSLGINSNSTNLTFEPFNEDGIHVIKLLVSNDTGCKDSVERVLKIYQSTPIYIPNSFTPDGDEFNNIFLPIIDPVDRLDEYDFSIYNRYGELIFQSLDPSFGWDGTYKGVKVQSGVYSWSIKAVEKGLMEVKTLRGQVNVFR